MLNKDGVRRSAFALLSRWDIGWGDVAASGRSWVPLSRRPRSKSKSMPNTPSTSNGRCRTSSSFRRDEALLLPDDLDYAALPGLSSEVKARSSPKRAHVPSARRRASKGSRRPR